MPDAVKFSVAGKMKEELPETLEIATLTLKEMLQPSERRKKMPKAERFRGREGKMKRKGVYPDIFRKSKRKKN